MTGGGSYVCSGVVTTLLDRVTEGSAPDQTTLARCFVNGLNESVRMPLAGTTHREALNSLDLLIPKTIRIGVNLSLLSPPAAQTLHTTSVDQHAAVFGGGHSRQLPPVHPQGHKSPRMSSGYHAPGGAAWDAPPPPRPAAQPPAYRSAYQPPARPAVQSLPPALAARLAASRVPGTLDPLRNVMLPPDLFNLDPPATGYPSSILPPHVASARQVPGGPVHCILCHRPGHGSDWCNGPLSQGVKHWVSRNGQGYIQSMRSTPRQSTHQVQTVVAPAAAATPGIEMLMGTVVNAAATAEHLPGPPTLPATAAVTANCLPGPPPLSLLQLGSKQLSMMFTGKALLSSVMLDAQQPAVAQTLMPSQLPSQSDGDAVAQQPTDAVHANTTTAFTVQVLTDTGASMNFISQAVVDNLQLPVLTMQVTIGDASVVKSAGQVLLRLTVGNFSCPVNCGILPFVGADLILGNTWCRQHKVDLLYSTNVMQVRDLRGVRHVVKPDAASNNCLLLTAMQFKRSLDRKDVLYQMTVKAVEPDKPKPVENSAVDAATLKTLRALTEEFKDVSC